MIMKKEKIFFYTALPLALFMSTIVGNWVLTVVPYSIFAAIGKFLAGVTITVIFVTPVILIYMHWRKHSAKVNKTV